MAESRHLSRREALRATGVSALAAGAAVVPFAGTFAEASPDQDAELRRLWAEWVAVWTELKKAEPEQRALRIAVYQEKKHLKSVFYLDRITETKAGRREWLAVERLHPLSNGRYRKLWRHRAIPGCQLSYDEARDFAKARLSAEMDAHRKQVDAIRSRHGLDRSEAKSEALRTRLGEIRQDIKLVPATTIFGVGVRMAVITMGPWEDDRFECFYSTLDTVGTLSGTQFRLTSGVQS